MAEQCWKCATPLRSSAVIGDFCPNPACDVVDALDPSDVFEVRIILDPARRNSCEAAPHPGTPKPQPVLAQQD
jgi:hypothetical protein